MRATRTFLWRGALQITWSYLLALLIAWPTAVSIADPRGSLDQQANPGHPKSHTVGVDVTALELSGGSSLKVISPAAFGPWRATLTSVLESAHRRLTSLFGEIPSFATSLRLMDVETFHLMTGAPYWTNALFYKGQILIPVSDISSEELENLARSVRHEYVHAVIHALAAGQCPGWLDEGLAQWAEGPENPALRPALARYLEHMPPLPLKLLQGGFTRLDRSMVAAAYAQSLIAAQATIDTFGFAKIRQFFDQLRAGHEYSRAFSQSFGMNEKTFENKLHLKLKHWSSSMQQARAQLRLLSMNK